MSDTIYCKKMQNWIYWYLLYLYEIGNRIYILYSIICELTTLTVLLMILSVTKFSVKYFTLHENLIDFIKSPTSWTIAFNRVKYLNIIINHICLGQLVAHDNIKCGRILQMVLHKPNWSVSLSGDFFNSFFFRINFFTPLFRVPTKKRCVSLRSTS